MCIGIIRNNSLVDGRARAESNPGHWARGPLLHMAAEWRGVGHFERKFQGKGASPTNDFWHQKCRVPGLSYGEKKLPKSSTAWIGCTNVTDSQTTDRQIWIAYSEHEREFTSAKNEQTLHSNNGTLSRYPCVLKHATLPPEHSDQAVSIN